MRLEDVARAEGELREVRSRFEAKSATQSEVLRAEAQLAARLGLHAEALKNYQELAVKQPGDARWPAQVAAERVFPNRFRSVS